MYIDERVASYRKRAVDLRLEAGRLADLGNRQAIMDIAERFDRLADRVADKDGGPISN
jgi:hypothetical protein